MGATVLVIGYYGSKEVDSFSWWQDLPNISEYDTIILDTTKLHKHWGGRIEHVSENNYKLLQENDLDARVESNLKVIKNKLLEKLEFDVTVYVLYTSEISIYRPPKAPIHTEDWRPISFDTVSETGKLIDVADTSYQEYFRDFKKWEFYFIADSMNIIELQDYYRPNWAVTSKSNYIATNKVKKPLALELTLFFHRYAVDEEALRYKEYERPFKSAPHHMGGRIVLLPVSNQYNTEPSIEILLRLSRQLEQTPPPSWVSAIEIPGETSLNIDIETRRQQLEAMKSTIEELETSLADLQKYKGLLYETGLTLQELVKLTLKNLGAEIESSPVTDEFIVNIGGKKALIEVKGNTKSITKADLGQLITDLGEYLKATDEDIGGILIGNAWRLEPIEARDKHDKPIFSQAVVKIAENRNIGLISSTELFEAYRKVLKEPTQKEAILNKIIGGEGIIKL